MGRAGAQFNWISFTGGIYLTCSTTTENGFCLLLFQLKHEYMEDFINLITRIFCLMDSFYDL